MLFSYFDMLSGEALYAPKIGHLRSPKLRELTSAGIGQSRYNLYLNLLAWDKDKLTEYSGIMQYQGAERLKKADVSFFDAITLMPESRELFGELLNFFIVEEVYWNPAQECYCTVCTDTDEQPEVVGTIDRSNCDEVRQRILLLNYVGLDKDQPPTGFDSKKTQELWEQAQQFLKKQSAAQQNEDKPEFRICNITSKLCTVHPSYNLLNIFDLTVFQLYDAFFQYGYMRSMALNERIFSNHGGDSFKFENWLKPIFHNI